LVDRVHVLGKNPLGNGGSATGPLQWRAVTVDYRKSLPPELSHIKAKANGVYTFVISHEAPDLVGDIVVQRGMKPVSDRIPAQVDHSGKIADVIGYWDELQVRGDHTTADLKLVDPGISKMADLVRGLANAGVRLAASIGFNVVKAEPLKPRGYKFNESLLHEISVVVVPCQPLALQIAKQFQLEHVIGDPVDGLQSALASQLRIKRASQAIIAAKRTIKGFSK